jgi:hypothetical protein
MARLRFAYFIARFTVPAPIRRSRSSVTWSSPSTSTLWVAMRCGNTSTIPRAARSSVHPRSSSPRPPNVRRGSGTALESSRSRTTIRCGWPTG